MADEVTKPEAAAIQAMPTQVKIAQAEAKVASGEITPSSPLSIDTAKATFNLWDNIQTRPGMVTAGSAVTAIIALVTAVTPYFTGDKKVSNLLDGQVLSVKIVDMPPLHVKDEPTPVPVPVPTPSKVKPLTIYTFGAELSKADADAFKARGHAVTHYATAPTEWADLLAKAGGPPRAFVASGGSGVWVSMGDVAAKVKEMER